MELDGTMTGPKGRKAAGSQCVRVTGLEGVQVAGHKCVRVAGPQGVGFWNWSRSFNRFGFGGLTISSQTADS